MLPPGMRQMTGDEFEEFIGACRCLMVAYDGMVRAELVLLADMVRNGTDVDPEGAWSFRIGRLADWIGTARSLAADIWQEEEQLEAERRERANGH